MAVTAPLGNPASSSSRAGVFYIGTDIFEEYEPMEKGATREIQMKSGAVSALCRHIEKKQLSQNEVRDITGLTQSDVSNLVNAKIERFSMGRLIRIADSLGAEVRLEFSFPEQPDAGIRKGARSVEVIDQR